jgi:D-alanyl-D-alanine carboxypeptidase/D-alanyl-D-alanine-endopeptidase (penicillin-binding protein 4)
MRSQIFKLIIFLLLFVTAGCARPVSRNTEIPQAVATRDALKELRSSLNKIFANPNFANAFWGVAIQSLDSGEILYEQNSGKLLMPASNMKILTAISALKTLGPDFVYETIVEVDQTIRDGVVKGNLMVVGTGDPTISADDLNDWALQLKGTGLTEVDGNIMGDDSAFEADRLGFGWSWDDLPYYYATETSALQFAENAITITITAGEANKPVTVKKEPDTSYVRVEENVQVIADAERSVQWIYKPETRTIFVSGTLPANGSDYGSFAINNPAAYFAHCFKETLERNGIRVRGTAGVAPAEIAGGTPAVQLITHKSKPLKEILTTLLKESQNLYAETLLKTIGGGKTNEGIKVVESTLAGMGIPASSVVVLDGSGLSRYNYVTPMAFVTMLRAIYHDDASQVFYNALPVAGVDGTLKSRMKGTAAENNVHAKTGSISNVRTLSGYMKTLDGEMIVFSLLANNFNAPSEEANAIQDQVVELLANFKR